MTSKENKSAMVNGTASESYQKLIASLKLENKMLSDENHVLRSKMAADVKKLSLVREWITNINRLSEHLKEIAKDWEPVTPTSVPNPVAKLNVDPRPAGLRVMLNRYKVTPHDNAAHVSTPIPSITNAMLDVKIKTEKCDDGYEAIAPVEPVTKKPSQTVNVLVEPKQKNDEKVAEKRKMPGKPKARQTRSMSKIGNDEEPSEKRFCLVTATPVLKSNIINGGAGVSRSKSDKTTKRSLSKRSSK